MAGRPKLPLNVHRLKGTAKKNPKRMKERENEPENIHPIGDPPNCLNKTEKAAWAELVAMSIDGVLGQSDRLAVEMAARKLVKMRYQKRYKNEKGKMVVDKPNASDETIFKSWCSLLGLTPVDRSKIQVPKKPPKNPFEDD